MGEQDFQFREIYRDIIDINLPDVSGFELMRRIRKNDPDARIIMLTLHADAELVTELIRAGASGFVLKLLAASELTIAIDQVLLGKSYRTAALDSGH